MSNIIIPNEIIQDKIYLIRNQKVMLDSDLAKMFEVTPRRLREQVSRNPDKFPEHFMFRLNEVEAEIMILENAIPSKQALGGSLPYVFYRTRDFATIKCCKKRESNSNEHKNY